MSVFDESSFTSSTPLLQPVTYESVQAALTEMNVNFGIDEDGDIVAAFEGNPCWVRILSNESDVKALMMLGRWQHTLSGEQYDSALEVVNEWNATRFFPRTSCVRTPEGMVVIGADYVRDVALGLTKEQLLSDLSVAITTCGAFFEHLDEHFLASCGGECAR
ncbi:YbjN domain-containing protein [Tessaracoccus sp. OH4464_COT-324]|uniref:YbjN domain-containing protein n=1 Tax=Tessaracoccus sp. OH4464_COT-324 TaxID=2491059 RepID=UPI000F63465C|nr:YbjN domain-containing protein [Tessaracoccus sp. OH4464_COT-324]RRD47998.1 YbjN domain-containing protein [Tessaracoccus sp. OH4464_COT-324]